LISGSRAACWITVDTAAASGTTTTTSMTSTMNKAATMRRSPRRRSSARISGQVATTIIVAHSSAGRNGFRTRNTPASSPPMTSTPRTILVRSREPGGSAIVWSFG
jgi:hypothetical protein